MRQQFTKTVESILSSDDRLTLLLGDIGVYGFRDSFRRFPDRVFNIGILEQSTISVAAGMAIAGHVPVVHTIAPFIVERALEQLKVDFCYQQLNGNFVSVGASYDYAALGCTHHCPGDVGLLLNLPDMEIIVPGSPKEFDKLFRQGYANGRPTYFRLSEEQNLTSLDVNYGQGNLVKAGNKATIIVVGPLLDAAVNAAENLDVSIIYLTSIRPFDANLIKTNCQSNKILLCEPFYRGTLARDLLVALYPQRVVIDYAGVPVQFLTNYGNRQQHDDQVGLVTESIRRKLVDLIDVN